MFFISVGKMLKLKNFFVVAALMASICVSLANGSNLTNSEIAAVLLIIGGPTLESNNDSDGDGIPDSDDLFPENPKETKDSDRDGVGDNSDVFPYDSTKSNAVIINFAEASVSSIVLNTDAVSLGATSRRRGGSKIGQEAVNNNIIGFDDNGNEIEDAVESSQILFVAESVLTPDGQYLYLFTSPHMQRALALPPEVCSLYRVALSTEAVDCLIAAAGDIQPKILNSRAIYSASRKGIDLRADGAAVLYGLNYERELPDGIAGGTQSGFAWFMSPDGELTGIEPTENFFIWDALWLDDTRIALLEFKYFELEGEEQYWRIFDTTTMTNAQGSPVPTFSNSTVSRSPLGLMIQGRLISKTDFTILDRGFERKVIEDSQGNFFGLYSGSLRQIDKDGQRYTGLEIETTEPGAQDANWSKQSGTGTDVKYSQVSSDDTFLAYTKGFLARTPIISIEGQAFAGETLEFDYADGTAQINFGGSAKHEWWGVFVTDPITDDLVIHYTVALTDENTQEKTLTIPADAVNAWLVSEEKPRCRADVSGESCLNWANPEPDEEGFCLHKYGTLGSEDRCVQLNQVGNKQLSYRVLRTDMESLRETRFDDAAVYPDGNGNAFPGVQTLALINGRLQAYFKDSRDHNYYLGVADANKFWQDGSAALLFAPAQNGSGDDVIITEATSLMLPAPLPLSNVTVSAVPSGVRVVVTIQLPAITENQAYEFNAFAGNPTINVKLLGSSKTLTAAAGPELTEVDAVTVEFAATDFETGQIYEAEFVDHFMVNGSVRQRKPAAQLLFSAP